MNSWWKNGALVGAVVLVAAATACSTTGYGAEGTLETSSKLLAPQASIKSVASAATTAKYGITTWKIFRGKSNMIMTGYDKHGKAVKGVTLGFAKGSAGESTIVTQIDDGSKFTAVHGLASGANRASAKLSPSSKAFLTQAASDATSINKQFNTLATSSTATGVSQCGADMSAVLTKALQCMSGNHSKATQAACIVAAQKAASSASSCKNTGTTSADTPAATAAKTATAATAETPKAATGAPAATGGEKASTGTATAGGGGEKQPAANGNSCTCTASQGNACTCTAGSSATTSSSSSTGGAAKSSAATSSSSSTSGAVTTPTPAAIPKAEATSSSSSSSSSTGGTTDDDDLDLDKLDDTDDTFDPFVADDDTLDDDAFDDDTFDADTAFGDNTADIFADDETGSADFATADSTDFSDLSDNDFSDFSGFDGVAAADDASEDFSDDL